MYLAIKPHKSCASAWLDAVKTVNDVQKHEAYNVIIDISDPLSQTTVDKQIISLCDDFLISQRVLPLQSVANTIFPEALYCRYGAPDFIKIFQEKLLPKVRKSDRWTGYYFERMTTYTTRNHKPLNQLWGMVERIRDKSNRSLNKFEVALFDPERDIDNSPYGGQCLSFLSFKLIPGTEKKLVLTAQYRNHYYIEKLLGNLIGLTRLMAFIATEANVGVGSLTVLSTHAYVDAPNKCRRSEVNALLKECDRLKLASKAAWNESTF
jgi:thymidylate synthase